MLQNESRDPNGGNVYYVTMHCDVVHITTVWVSSLSLDCNAVFAIKAYRPTFGVSLTYSSKNTAIFFQMASSFGVWFCSITLTQFE